MAETLWLDGRLVPEAEVRLPFFSHTLHYGLGVFEGIRCYAQDSGGSAIFRLADHVRRLLDSARMCLIPVPFAAGEIAEACRATVQANALPECYIRPLIWLGEGPMGIGSTTNQVHVGVGAFAWGAYLGEKALETGIRCGTSSLLRISTSAHLTKAKICGQYVNSILAKRLAALSGYDEALLLDGQGLLAEGTGENAFVLRDGVLSTPPRSAPILPGLTRDTILTLARERRADLGLADVVEGHSTRGDLYSADEVFLTGTAAEITPVTEIDGRRIGAGRPGRVALALAKLYQDVVRGRDVPHPEWLAAV